MQEAEVSLRLALYFVKEGYTDEDVRVSLDGAHIKTGKTVHFPIKEFLEKLECTQDPYDCERWQGKYSIKNYGPEIIITSNPGVGDVVVKLRDGRRIWVECKKGKDDKRGQEYSLMREAIGQLVTGQNFNNAIIPMVAVPYTPKSYELATKWSELSQIRTLGIKFALVREDGNVYFV